jgi:hypothetical protein
MSCCAIERDWELDGESEAWERLMGGEADMVQTMMCF